MGSGRKPEIEDWKLYHEIGHGITAHLFDNYFFSFQKVTFKLDEIGKEKFHPEDSGYTIALPVDNFEAIVKSDVHKAALVDGLYLLSGIAGSTFLTNANFSLSITSINFKQVLDLRGADGDFDIISRARRPYGWLLNYLDIDAPRRLELHSKLVQILKESFSHPEIHAGVQVLLVKIKTDGELLPIDFQNAFDGDLTQQINQTITDKLSVNNFGEIG